MKKTLSKALTLTFIASFMLSTGNQIQAISLTQKNASIISLVSGLVSIGAGFYFGNKICRSDVHGSDEHGHAHCSLADAKKYRNIGSILLYGGILASLGGAVGYGFSK